MKLLILLIVSSFILGTLAVPKNTPNDDNGIGFAFSGAGGRIAQHIALMQALVTGAYPEGKPIRPSYISGASSGSLSAVALNAIIEAQDKNLPNGFTWEKLEQLIISLNTSDVYDNSYAGLAKILTYNIFEGYFLDNSPLRKFLSGFLLEMGYSKLGDLYLPTQITVVNQSSGLDLRLWSTDPTYQDLLLIDILMASTAMPMAFPPTKIPGLGDTIWIDGGTGIDTIPIVGLLEQPKVKEIYIICYYGALQAGGDQVPPYLDYLALLKNGLATIDDMRVDLFAGTIDIAADSGVPSYTYIPTLNQTFTALDFDAAKVQYELTQAWTQANNPIPLTSNYVALLKEQIYKDAKKL